MNGNMMTEINQGIPILIDINGSHFAGITDYPTLTHGDVSKQDITQLSTYIKDMVGIGVIIPDEALEDYVREAANLPKCTALPDERPKDERREAQCRAPEKTADEPEVDPESLFNDWFHDYSKLLADKMTPVWQDAYTTGRRLNPLAADLNLDIQSAEDNVRQWIAARTGELITNCCDDQIKAVRYLVAEAQSRGLPSAETARYIRPTIGLTERQAEANFKHYTAVRDKLKEDHPRMSGESVERKAREAAAKYAEKQHRYRVETIARTEIATVYAEGNDAAVRQSIAEGFFKEVEKEWVTARNDRVCPACVALEGVRIGMDEAFKTKSGRREITASIHPLHPRCKCVVKYIEITPPTQAAGHESGGDGLGAGTGNSGVPEHAPPEYLGTLDDLSEEMVQSTLRKYEDKIAGSDIENAVVISRQGSVWQCYGNESNVYPNVDLKEDVLRGA